MNPPIIMFTLSLALIIPTNSIEVTKLPKHTTNIPHEIKVMKNRDEITFMKEIKMKNLEPEHSYIRENNIYYQIIKYPFPFEDLIDYKLMSGMPQLKPPYHLGPFTELKDFNLQKADGSFTIAMEIINLQLKIVEVSHPKRSFKMRETQGIPVIDYECLFSSKFIHLEHTIKVRIPTQLKIYMSLNLKGENLLSLDDAISSIMGETVCHSGKCKSLNDFNKSKIIMNATSAVYRKEFENLIQKPHQVIMVQKKEAYNGRVVEILGVFLGIVGCVVVGLSVYILLQVQKHVVGRLDIY